ncbi:MAG: HU family DNA-binding protein [Proteobacteria bacterium]|nr:HU family DNA-binding protein [Pseudomonadota bacterium]MBU4287340.1 HU family DNA-binding protein [Pseudomonadota bacterium]
MNRTDLAQKISTKTHIRKTFSKKLIDIICEEITKELERGKRVYLQKLGAFHRVTRQPRRYYDPRTKKIKIKPAHKDVIFRPSEKLIRRIAKIKTGSV